MVFKHSLLANFQIRHPVDSQTNLDKKLLAKLLSHEHGQQKRPCQS